jgi:urease accessory protein
VKTAAALHSNAEIFAANRATGNVTLSVAAAGAVTRRSHVHEDGSLRVRFPNVTQGALEAVLVNTAGGMAGGDRFGVSLSAGAGASLIAGTAAAEKIYRTTGADTEVTVALDVAEGGRLAWLPQETILFDRARLSRRIDIALAEDAALVVAEALVFGRLAMGEAVQQGLFADRWRVRRGGKLVFAESARLDGAIAAKLAQAAVTAGGVAIATVLIAPGSEAARDAVRALEFAGEVGISAWNGIAVARLCAKDGAALRHDLVALLAALKQPLPRLWVN